MIPVARIDQTPFQIEILHFSHDGRGVGRRGDGKTVFVAGALPGEQVIARLSKGSRKFDEAETVEVVQASPDRVTPRCPHFGTCGGCVLQHLAEDQQIVIKQQVLLDRDASGRRRRLRIVDGDVDFEAAVARTPEAFGDGGRVGQRVAREVSPSGAARLGWPLGGTPLRSMSRAQGFA